MKKKIRSLSIGLLIYALICALLGYMLHLGADYTPNMLLSFREVFFNNLSVNYKAIFFSFVTFGIYGLYFIGSEMFFLGFIIRSVANQENILNALSYISFHSIIEIPTIILSGAMGIIFWMLVINAIKRKQIIKKHFYFLAILIISVFFLVLIAAGIETTITKTFVQHFVMEVN